MCAHRPGQNAREGGNKQLGLRQELRLEKRLPGRLLASVLSDGVSWLPIFSWLFHRTQTLNIDQ